MSPNLKPTDVPQPLDFREQACPQCQATIPVYLGYPAWCDQCGWNLRVESPWISENLFDKLYQTISQKSSQHLFREMMIAKTIRNKLNLSKILAFLLAGCVHSITLAFVILGIWLIGITLPRLWGVILALPCFVMAWLLLPHIPKLKETPLPREALPTLYQITDRIAQALHSSPIDGIIPDIQYNASFGQFGWRRKRMLFLGLPLFAILDGNEKVALLGHEIAHGVNGDPNRSFFIWAAISSLVTWYQIIHPHNRWHLRAGLATIFIFLCIYSAGTGIKGVSDHKEIRAGSISYPCLRKVEM